MLPNRDRAPRFEYYAEPAFYKHPPASSLPIPKFIARPPSGLKVSTHLSVGEWKAPLDAVAQIKQASSESDKCRTGSQSRINEDSEAQARCETDLRQRQSSNIDSTEQDSTKVWIRYTPQEMIDIRDHKYTIPANVHLQRERRQQVRQHVAENLVVLERSTSTYHLLQLETKMPERSMTKQQWSSQQRLDELNEIREEKQGEGEGEGEGEGGGGGGGGEGEKEERGGEGEKEDEEEVNSLDDETGTTSSSDEESTASTDGLDAEIDRYEYSHQEMTSPNSFQVANFLANLFERHEQTEANGDTSESEEAEEAEAEAEGDWEVDEGADIFFAFDVFEDEGYFSME